jgi:Retrotransposon gag protein
LATIWDDHEGFKYPTFKDFLEIFTLYFKPINQTQTANNQLISLRQGKRTVEEYLAEFRLLTSLAGMTADTTSDNIHLINYFQRGLNPAIAKKIALSDNVPTTIAEWSDRAVQYDTNYRLTMAMLGKAAYRKSDGDNWRTGSLHQRDPNAMEIDVMTAEKQTFLMKQGFCFKCEGWGHLARDCKGKKKDTSPPKKDIKDIHALLTALTAKEKKELLSLPNTSLTKEKDEDF